MKEAKERERAERKTKREERHQRRLSETDSPQTKKTRLERELEIQVTLSPGLTEVDCSFRLMCLIPSSNITDL